MNSSRQNLQETTNNRLENDQVKLVNIFPSEVWLLILETLSCHPNSLERISNASLYFRQLLQPNRAIWLFPHVWKHLAQHLNEILNEIASRTSKFRKNFSVILSTRAVCRDWCSTVDEYYRDIQYHFNLKNIHDAEQLGYFCNRSPIMEGFRNSSQFPKIATKLLKHFAETHAGTSRSPWIANGVVMPVVEQYPAIQEMLQIYGQSIWHCFLKIDRDVQMRTLQQMLMQMPNLKSLQIYYTGGCRKRDIRRLTEEIGLHPFLHLENLQLICLACVPHSIAQELRRTNGQAFVKETDS